MSVSQKLRWKQLINQIRFRHNELELVKEIVATSGSQFHEYYLSFAATHNLDIPTLNQQHSKRLEKLYNSDPQKIPPPKNTDLGTLIPSGEIPAAAFNEMDETIRASFHKLFKKIATKIHPDVGSHSWSEEEKIRNKALFHKARVALDDRKYFILLDIAEQLSITQPRNYKDQIGWMKKEIEVIEAMLNQEKNTYNYYFAECETEEEKQMLVRKFIAHLFGIVVE